MMMGYAFDDVHSHLVMNDVGTDALDAIALRKGKAVAQLTTVIGANMPVFGAVYGTKGHIDIPEFKKSHARRAAHRRTAAGGNCTAL